MTDQDVHGSLLQGSFDGLVVSIRIDVELRAVCHHAEPIGGGDIEGVLSVGLYLKITFALEDDVALHAYETGGIAQAASTVEPNLRAVGQGDLCDDAGSGGGL